MATPIREMQTQLANPETKMPAVRAGFFDMQSFELMQRISKAFASSTLVPKDYQNNLANCMIALNLAQRINGDVLMVMQNLIIVHGRPTWSAQYLIATANMCGRFSAIRFEFFGEHGTDTWGCRAWAIEKATGEKLVGSDITIGIAKKEGWYGKNGSKWQSIPQQMLMYRAGAWWVRAYAPELSMGLMTADEATDTFDATQGSDGTYSVSIGDLRGEHEHGNVNDSGPTEEPPADYIADSTGEIWDQSKHATGADGKPVFNTDGTFRKRRGTSSQEQQTQQQATQPAGPTVDEIRAKIANATSSDELDVAMDLCNSLPDGNEKSTLKALCMNRFAELTGGGDSDSFGME